MQYLDLTYPDAADNLQCDDELLELCDRGESDGVLRVWELGTPAVVAGRSNQTFEGVRRSECRSMGIPVVRRSSGGGTVVLGPGSLNYALVFRIDSNEALSTIRGTNRFVMERHRRMLERVTGRSTSVEGFTDLTIDDCKVSGNAQRRRRNAVLFHGTFLIGLDLPQVEELLEIPSVAPDYRRERRHLEFLMNVDVPASLIRDGLRLEWSARSEYDTAASGFFSKSGDDDPRNLG